MAFLNDITLGHYYPADSALHRLDPRTKLLALMMLMTSLLVSFRAPVLFGFFSLSILLVLMSRIPIALVFRNLFPFLWLFLITILVHILWTPGEEIFAIPVIKLYITYEGLYLGLLYSLRLALLIVYAALLTLTTSPIEMTDALEKLLAPLRRLRVPTHEIVMMLTLSLRFIPTLLEEALRLRGRSSSG